MEATSNVPLSGMKSGAVEELWQDALRRALENVLDPNTKAAAKREIAIKVTLKPSGDRSAVEVDATVTTKFPGPDSVKTLMVIHHGNKGEVLATEPEQAGLFQPGSTM
jgi:hypothetical protein